MRLEQAITANTTLAPFHAVGALGLADVHLAQALARLYSESDPAVLLAAALACRGVRQGSACVDVATIAGEVVNDLLDPALIADTPPETLEAITALRWPEAGSWTASLTASGLVGTGSSAINQRPLRLDDGLLYLERQWASEERIRSCLARRQSAHPPTVDHARLADAIADLPRGDLPGGEPDLQAEAVMVAVRSWTSAMVGGPGTGKTTSVAKLLAVLARVVDRPLSVALAAPSGKAAARLETSVRRAAQELVGSGWSMPQVTAGLTLHRLLGAHGAGKGFTHDRHNPLAHDVIVLDEVSMVDTYLFGHLLSALNPTTRLVMVGDPHQLPSIEAGRVLADVTTLGLTIGGGDQRSSVVELRRNWRFSGGIRDLANAIRVGDAEAAASLLATPPDDSIELVDVDVASSDLAHLPRLRHDIVEASRSMVDAAARGDAESSLRALDSHRLLCAHREGPFGVSRWTREIGELLREELPGYGVGGEWFVGRPLLVTVNSRDIGVSNGDSGVIIATPEGPRLAVGEAQATRLLSASLVEGLQSLYAMTVHKSQGSQFEVVTVVLPPLGSPLLTRELLYTAVTRAQRRVRLIGDLNQVRAAVAQNTRRLTGLGRTRARVDGHSATPR